jgi:hypothetical protein
MYDAQVCISYTKKMLCTYIYSAKFNLKQCLSLKHYLHQSCNKDACCRKTNRSSCFYIDPLPGSVFGIATGYGLEGPGIESQWGARFSAPVLTDPRAHPASCTIGTGSFPGVKSGRGVTLTPHPLLVPWSRKSRAIPLRPPTHGPYGLYRASVPVQG